MISRWNLGGRHLVPAFVGTTPWLVFSVRRVGKGALAPYHHLMLRTRWWARFALPTLRTARASAISRLNARGLQSPCPSLTTEGAGKTGCALHPRSRVQSAPKKAHTSIQVQRRQSGLPCAVVYGLLRALPGDRLSCHRHFAGLASRELGASTGAPGPHDFAVREPSCVRLRKRRVHRIPPRVRDDREPPLYRVRRAES